MYELVVCVGVTVVRHVFQPALHQHLQDPRMDLKHREKNKTYARKSFVVAQLLLTWLMRWIQPWFHMQFGRILRCLTFLFSLWDIFLRNMTGCSPGEPVFLVKLTDGILSVE